MQKKKKKEVTLIVSDLNCLHSQCTLPERNRSTYLVQQGLYDEGIQNKSDQIKE